MAHSRILHLSRGQDPRGTYASFLVPDPVPGTERALQCLVMDRKALVSDAGVLRVSEPRGVGGRHVSSF